MSISKISVRLSPDQHKELRKRALAANMSINRFLIDSSLGTVPRNDKALSDLMGEFCKLEFFVQQATDLETLKKDIRTWRHHAITILGECAEWPR